MKRTILIITTLACFFGIHVSAQGQLAEQNAELIIGKWQLISHIVFLDGKGRNMMNDDFTFTYVFNEDGTYSDKADYSFLGLASFMHKGSWKISDDGKKLILYNIEEIPAIEDTKYADVEYDIKSLNETEMRIPEHMFNVGEDPGVSVYEKLPN